MKTEKNVYKSNGLVRYSMVNKLHEIAFTVRGCVKIINFVTIVFGSYRRESIWTIIVSSTAAVCF